MVRTVVRALSMKRYLSILRLRSRRMRYLPTQVFLGVGVAFGEYVLPNYQNVERYGLKYPSQWSQKPRCRYLVCARGSNDTGKMGYSRL